MEIEVPLSRRARRQLNQIRLRLHCSSDVAIDRALAHLAGTVERDQSVYLTLPVCHEPEERRAA